MSKTIGLTFPEPIPDKPDKPAEAAPGSAAEPVPDKPDKPAEAAPGSAAEPAKDKK